MRFSFSTKGWHGVSWQEFVETAADLAYDGIEIHNLFSPAMAEKGCPADKQAGAATYRALFDRKLSIPCINTTGEGGHRYYKKEAWEAFDKLVNWD